MKKSNSAIEMANAYPTWSRIRYDQQSLGFQFLNAVAEPLENMSRELVKSKANYYLSTMNLDEIDITYRVTLPVEFDFSLDRSDPLNPVSAPPTVSGLIDGTWYPISLAEENSVKKFWYESIPNRISLGTTVSGIDDLLLSSAATDFPVTGVWEHHLSGGNVWAEVTGGTEYLSISNGKALRGRVVIEGTTRKGTKESESLVFPWDMKQRSKKEWKEINYIGVFNMEDAVQVSLYSGDFNNPPYLDPWNTRFSENRNKIDEFWELGLPETSGSSITLDRVEYISDEWQQLVQGLSDKEVKERWELVDGSLDTISGIDLALQPFSDNAWVITSDSKLICYDLNQYMPNNLSLIRDRTAGPDSQIELEKSSVVLGEDIIALPWHARPLKEILRYRMWYQTPSGVKYGLLAGTAVSFTSDFWVFGSTTITRSIENLVSIPTTERGEYLLVLEVVYIDGEEQSEKVLVPVNYKTPHVEFDLSALMSETPVGIEFNSDQKLWIKGQTKYYQFDLHTDTMVIDYLQRTLYFKENYEEVIVDSDE